MEKITKLLTQSANNTIPIQKPTMSPKRIAAANEFKHAQEKLKKQPHNSIILRRVQETKRKMEELQQMHLDRE